MNNYEKILKEIQSTEPNLERVAEALAQEGFDINTRTKKNRSLLEQAVLHKQSAICQLLVDTRKIKQALLNKALSSAFNKYLKAPQVSYTMIKILLKAGAALREDIIPENVFPILDGNFEAGIQLLELLLAHNAEVNAVEVEHGYNLLTMIDQVTMQAALSEEERQANRVRLFELLLQYRINPELTSEAGGKTALMSMAESGDIKFVRQLLDYGADMTLEDYGGETALEYGRRGDLEEFFIETLKRLYGEEMASLMIPKNDLKVTEESKRKIEENREGEALFLASLKGDYEEVSRLLKLGIDPNYHNPSRGAILMNVVSRGITICRGINSSQLNKRGESAEKAISNVITQLVIAGADINLIDGHNNTALHYVQSPQIAQLLIDLGVNLKVKNNFGETILHTIIKCTQCRGDSIELLDILLKHDLEINEKAARGQTALHIAVLIGQEKMAQCLLDHGADIDVQDIYGKTPLHRAVQKDHRDIIKLLLERGANPGIRCLLGKAAWDYVYVTEEVKTLLLEANQKLEDAKKKSEVEEGEASTEKRARLDDQEQRVSTSSSSIFHTRLSSSAAGLQTNTQVGKLESEESKSENEEATESVSPSSAS